MLGVGLALLCAAPAPAPARAGAPLPTVRVGFADRQAPNPLVGFVHGMDAVSPSDARIAPLKPGLWRGRLRDVPYERATALGGRYTYILSDRWGYPGDAIPRQPPYADWKAWRKFVRQIAQQGRKGDGVVWDVWNEPNHPHFWRGTREQLYETYRIAWEEIHRIVGPDAVVSGPSTSYYSPEWIGGLVQYCADHGCHVDALSWHEFPTGSIPAIQTRLEDARRRWIYDPRYAAADVREIHVNEVIGQRDQYLPAETLGTMRYLERGRADAAARACWPGSTGEDNCYNETLGGLLTPRTFLPRSVWWTMKAFADGAGSRVLTKFSDPYVVGVGSRLSARPETAQVLIGALERRVGTRRSARRTDVRVTLRRVRSLPFLRHAKRVRLTVQRFPATGEAPLRVPETRSARVRSIDRDRVELTLHDVELHAAYRLLVGRP